MRNKVKVNVFFLAGAAFLSATGLAAASDRNSAAKGDVQGCARIMIERPSIRWLFGGFGFQNAESRLTALMTDEFRDQRAVKSFRELSPSFSRVYVGMNGEYRESLDRFADYYDETFRRCDTTIYAVGGAMPEFADKLDVEAHAEGVAKSLEYLVKVRDCRKIRFYCLTNELMSGDQWAYFHYQEKMPLFKKFHQALYDAFRRHGLDILLAASAGLKWIRAKTPHPQGMIEADLEFSNGNVAGEITLPGTLSGLFRWNGHDVRLHPGRQKIAVIDGDSVNSGRHGR